MASRVEVKNGEDKVQLTTYISPEIKERFRQRCETEGSCPSVKVRQFIYQYVNQ